MLHSITWQEFFWTFAALVGVYYGATILILYRGDLRGLFNKRTSDSREPSLPNTAVVMGSVKADSDFQPRTKTENIVVSEEIQIAQTAPEMIDTETSKINDDALLLLGTISDLLQEIKTISDFILENKSSKEESLIFLKTLLSRYPHLRNSKYQNATDLYILNEFKGNELFKLELLEIEQLWS